MFPISSDYEVKGIQPVTWAIIVLCGVIAFIEMVVQPSFDPRIFQDWGAHPALVVYDLFPWNVDSPRIALSLLTSMFVHANVMHVLLNMLFFHCFSLAVELVMGSWRYAIFYLLCGFCGTLVHCLGNPTTAAPMVGASGAVAGVLAAHALLLPWSRIRISLRTDRQGTVPAWGFVALWLFLQFVDVADGNAGDVAWLAHVGGVVAGLVFAPLFVRPGMKIFAAPPDSEEEGDWGSGVQPALFWSAPLALLFLFLVVSSVLTRSTAADPSSRGQGEEVVAQARLEGAGVPKRPAEGLALYREAAGLDRDVATRLGARLLLGKGIDKNQTEAVHWLEAAADRQQPQAMQIFSEMLIEGTLVPRDVDRAKRYLATLAGNKDGAAAYRLAQFAEQGAGTGGVDLAEAARYYGVACDSPLDFLEDTSAKAKLRGTACYTLSQMLFDGRGIAADQVEGRRRLEQAAQSNFPEADNMLAVLLTTGDPHAIEIGTQPSDKDDRIRSLLSSAAWAGNADAMYNYARFGEARPDMVGAPHGHEIQEWYEKSAKAGNPRARAALDRLASSAPVRQP